MDILRNFIQLTSLSFIYIICIDFNFRKCSVFTINEAFCKLAVPNFYPFMMIIDMVCWYTWKLMYVLIELHYNYKVI